jgi:hypothetical protein
VLMEMVDEFQYRLLSRNADVVNRTEMLGVLGKTDTAAVGYDRDVELEWNQ